LNKIPALVIACGIGVVVSCTQLLAHHSFAAEYDAKRPVRIEGTITRVEWTNPHSWIHVELARSDGQKEQWMIEAGSPNALFRRGFTKQLLPPGKAIVVNGFRAKDGSTKANGSSLKLPDGRELFLGSSGTGAPNDPEGK
jgi:hypothetical protein